MCGIFGVVGAGGIDGRRFVDALNTLERRGPDDTGVALLGLDGARLASVEAPPDRRAALVAGNLGDRWTTAIGFRRLSIIDLSSAGHQPMATSDKRYWMVYNGELYNYVELRAELEQTGRRFATSSDSEVVLQAYAHWGEACFERFVGMWALAIVDTYRRVLMLSRDPFGIKPLYVSTGSGPLMFASDIRPLLSFGGVNSRRIDAEVAHRYLVCSAMPGDDSSFVAGVCQIAAGSTIEYSLDRPGDGRTLLTRPSLPMPAEHLSASDAAEQLRSMFLDSVRLHLRSDVPVGAALSGGIDSSGIVTAMRRIAGDQLDLRTFSYSADLEVIDESAFKQLVAGQVGALHHVVRIGKGDFACDLDRLIECQCEPFRGPSVYAQYRVFQLARESGVIVMLDGQGADELFGGYIPFVALRVVALLRQGRVLKATRLLRGARRVCSTPGSKIPLEFYVANRLAPSRVEDMARRRRHATADARWLLPMDSGTEARSPRSALRQGVRGEAELETWTTSLPELLRYEDRNSMAHSLESRVPFLTRQLALFALSLPDHLLVDDGGRTKAVLRDALVGLVPQVVLDRREKVGFQPPDASWFEACDSWTEHALDAGSRLTGLPIDVSALSVTVKERHRAGQPALDGHLFRALCLLRWATLNNLT